MQQTHEAIESVCKEIVSKFQIKIDKIADKITISFYLGDTLVSSENIYESDILQMMNGEFKGWMYRFCEDAANAINEGIVNRLYEKVMKLIVVTSIQHNLQSRLGKNE